MKNLFRSIDQLLRGGYTKPEDLGAGRIDVPVRRLVLVGLIMGGTYGLFMGLYGSQRGDSDGALQLLATIVKVPLLFLLTLAVTFPSLYAFSALSRSRLQFAHTLRLLLAAIALNLAVLASLGPVTAFFTFSTESYSFMVILNVAVFALSGAISLSFLRRALDMVFQRTEPKTLAEATILDEDSPAAESVTPPGAPAVSQFSIPRPRSPRGDRSRLVFGVWIFVYGVVGAQMGWILRPFIGHPDLPFEFFRERESNFFAAVVRALGDLLGSGG